MASSGLGGRRDVSLYLGVALELMSNAVVVSSEQTYLEQFGTWVDFRVPCGVASFLRHYGDDMVKVWCLFECVAYAFATKKLRSATMDSCLSAITYFHCFSCVSELDTTHPVIANVLKGASRSHADAVNQASVRQSVSWVMLLAAESLTHTRRILGSGFVACSVSVVLLLDARVGKCLGKRGRASSRVVLLAAGVDVVCFRGTAQLGDSLWSNAGRVEVRFRRGGYTKGLAA